MQIDGGSFNAGSIRITPFSLSGKRVATTAPDVSVETPEQLLAVRDHLLRIRESLDVFSPLENGRVITTRGVQITPAQVSSTTALGLGSIPATPTVLQSTDEVNAIPTSYSPFSPVVQGISTTDPSIGGVYDGSNGADTLTFQFTSSGIVGLSSTLTLEVETSQGDPVESISLSNYQVGDVYTLANGLEVSFGDGTYGANDTFEVSVSDVVGSAVDPTNSFSGGGENAPGFENGLSVSAGAFELNGVTIDVLSNDTINSIVDRINQLPTQVTASFDAGSERVVLTHDSPGAAGTIVVGSDSSGFLAATKLASAVQAVGDDSVPDSERSLDSVSGFSSINSGSLLVNGVAIAVDVANDSLLDVLDRIEANTTARASYNAATDKVELRMTSGAALQLDSGSTQFFDEIGVGDGDYQSTSRDVSVQSVVEGVTTDTADQFVESYLEFAELFNGLFDEATFANTEGSYVEELHGTMLEAIAKVFGKDGPKFESKIGIRFDFRNEDQKGVLDVTLGSQRELRESLHEDPLLVNELMFGDEDKDFDGLVERIQLIIDISEKALGEAFGETGSLVDETV